MTNKIFNIDINSKRGGLSKLILSNDNNELNWVESDTAFGSPYGKYSLVGMVKDKDKVEFEYNYKQLKAKTTILHHDKSIEIEFDLTNDSVSDRTFKRGELGINTPFNDNYESADICLKKKCHMHIWCGKSATYVLAKRMSGADNNIALLLTKGSIDGYAIQRRWNSNDRGDLSLLLGNITIKAGESVSLGFVIYGCDDFEDFYKKAEEYNNFLRLDADKYSAAVGENITMRISGIAADSAVIKGFEVQKDKQGYYTVLQFETQGEHRIEICYEDKTTYADFYIFDSQLNQIDKRLNFIIDKQQISEGRRKKGAIALYDNETESKFVENKVWNDRNYARERIGMLTGMIDRLIKGGLDKDFEQKLTKAVELGMEFVDDNIVKDDGNVYEKPKYKRNGLNDRLYNYSMFMNLYLILYRLTGDKKRLYKAANIAKCYYSKGGQRFYAINLPLSGLYRACAESDEQELAQELKSLFLAHGDSVVKIGTSYPAHEVKYEQSIVAPSLDILLECYLIDKDEKYLDEAKRQLPLLNAFIGRQPSFHNSAVSIRHWDGYWFGKRKMYGDTMPHYWSCITAAVLAKFARITGKKEYTNTADECLNNNLCLIQEGRGSCAYLMPTIINGKKGEYYDPWANDQDWVMWYNLEYNTQIKE